MPFMYQSGEPIRKGDRVLFHSEPGEIEFVVDKLVGEPAMDWYMGEYGGAVMVLEPKFWASVSPSHQRSRGFGLSLEGPDEPT